MDGPGDYHTKRKTNIIWCHLHVESKNMLQMNLFTKQKQIHSLRKQIYGYQVGRMRVGIDWDLGIDVYTIPSYFLEYSYQLFFSNIFLWIVRNIYKLYRNFHKHNWHWRYKVKWIIYLSIYISPDAKNYRV